MVRFLREQGARWLLLLAICELALLAAAMVVGMHLRYWNSPVDIALHTPYLLPRALAFAATLVGALAALGLYQPRLRESWFGLLARQAVGFALGGIAVVLLYYVVPQAYVGRGILGLSL